ncbi:unnamed protein product [Phaedon cochleariae]|uniref:Uncharacterized protein n=1 Tax=Phaedon cochleariae TaxID=80249 RepID=A0A9N9SE82_PHACE|nr:unnamed protein product [Phaedon cochleariae]
MSCSYGQRGSLTAICTNATSDFFKLTTYRFDYLDETLLCLNCDLNFLEASTFDIPGNEIKTLDIRNSSITFIWPKAFIGMIHMERLLLSNNPIEKIPTGAFEGIRKVRYLEMRNSTTNLEPRVFKELHLLEVLDLRGSQLLMVRPKTFEGLHNLKLLDLSHNKLVLGNTSDIFEPLVNLRILLLNDNFIFRLQGQDFRMLRSLTTLNLARNAMTNFSIDLEPQNRLRTLNLSQNYLSSASFLPGAFENLTNLEDLDLSRNSFDNITLKLFQGLSKLTVLNLGDNRLRGINTGHFSGLPHLRILNVSNNKIDSLKITGRLQMHSLVQMDLSNNNIQNFDYLSLITRAPRLRFINLLNNSLSCIMEDQLRALFLQDHVVVLVSNGKDRDCPKVTTESSQELLDELKEQLQDPYVNSTLLVWMFVLITIVMLLIGVLFYVQFFILLGMGGQAYRNIRLLKNVGSTDVSEF